MKFFTIQLAMVWLVLQATPHLVHGGGLCGLSSSSAIDSTSNDSSRGRSRHGFAAKAETRDWFRPHPAKPNSFAKLSVSVSHPARPRLDAETTSLASISIDTTYVDYRSMILLRTYYRTLRYIVVHT